MKELIKDYLERVATEVYDMPESQLDLMMDNHRCINWEGEEYFLPDSSIEINEADELIYEFLIACRPV